MALTAQNYQQLLKALQPPGTALPGGPDSEWQRLVRGIAEEFARLDGRWRDLRREADPRTAFELLEDWERITGLPDECVAFQDQGLGERRSEVEARLITRGGQSRQYFIEIGRRLGYEVEIEEVPVSVSAGLVAGDELSAAHADRYAWRVSVPVNLSSAFISGNAVAGDELGYWRPVELECLIRRLKPAHTVVEFEYLEEY